MAEVVDTKPLKYYAVPTDKEPYSSIVHLPIAANNFELKPSLISMVQQNMFFELSMENPNLHLSIFVDNYGILKANSVDQNVTRLRLLPFLLQDRARA